MSLKFEQLDPLKVVDFGFGEQDNNNSNENGGDLDILDEFLDKRLYEDHQPQHQSDSISNPRGVNNDASASSNFLRATDSKDEEMFNNFLTDEINKNDFILFSPNANGTNGDSSIDVDFAQLDNALMNQPLPDLNATTPTSIDGDFSSTKLEMFSTPQSMNSNDSTYEMARNILTSLKFGTDAPTQYTSEFPKQYLDIDEHNLPYSLTLKNLPSYSRVETQIKLDLVVSPPPPEYLIHLPSDTIAKQKFCLSQPLSEDLKKSMLFLETFVLTATTMKPCNTCSRCVRREQKRASRRKSGVSDNLNWTTNTSKRAIIFNCKEIISFPPSSPENSKIMDISARIVCYCRHHQESKGFKLLFILKNSKDEVVAKHLSTPIMIMDRKKNLDDGSGSVMNGNSDTNAASASASNTTTKIQPLSPTSIEEDSSEPHTTDSRVFKRKKNWSPELSDGFSITPQRKVSSGINLPNSVALSSSSSALRPLNDTTPIIQRIIPAQGPLRGGIEVTLLGTNFKQGLNVKFGINRALSTQCWSDSTMVTYLPPSSQPGQVMVTIEDPEQPSHDSENIGSSIFTYLDDTDRQMIELALQIVGLKMNGKLEDARNIARKIIGSESSNDSPMSSNPAKIGSFITNNALSQLTAKSDEELILEVIAMLPANPNLSICTTEAQTLLHLSCLKGYYKLVSSLLHKGARVDVRDINGYTPLHLAAIAGDRTCIELLLSCKANLSIKNNIGETAEDVANINVLDIFESLDAVSVDMSRKHSNSSLASSIFSIEEFQAGMHVSRLTSDILGGSDDDDSYSEEGEDVDASDEESDNDEYEYDSSIYESPRAGSSTVLNDDSTIITPNDIVQSGTIPSSDKSIWKKVRNVFNEELPRYDELFPNSKTWKLGSFTNSTSVTSITATAAGATTSEGESSSGETSDTEDIFQKFFHQRKNFQNDKMLLFFWLPLLIVIVSSFILLNSGWNFEFNDQIKEFIRKTLGTIMLGNERFKAVFNKHLSSVNDAVTSVINVS